jgi:hypothetical protein
MPWMIVRLGATLAIKVAAVHRGKTMRNLMIVFASLAVGCEGTTLYSVSTTPTSGIPFYVQEQWDIQTRTFQESYFELTATETIDTVGKDGKTTSTKQPAVTAYATTYAKAADVYLAFVNSETNEERWNKTGGDWQKHTAGSPPTGLLLAPPLKKTTIEDIKDTTLVSTDHSRTQIPSPVPSYLNVNVPHGGTANAEVDLNADGTLSKAIAQKQDQLPGTITTAAGAVGAAALGAVLNAPLAALFAHYYPVPSASKSPAAPGAKTISAVELAVVEVRYVYVVKVARKALVTMSEDKDARTKDAQKGTAKVDPCLNLDTLLVTPSSDCRVDLTITTQRGDAPGSSDKGDNSIKFSGSVVLPQSTTPPPSH